MEDSSDQQPEQMAETPAPRQMPQPVRAPKLQRNKLLFYVIAGAVLLAGAAAYWFFLKDDSPKKQTNQAQQTNTPVETPVDPTPVTYKSTKLNIELTHRKDWTLKESADGQITITSPSISYAAANDTATTGVFTVKVRKGVPDAMKSTIEKSIAARKSEVIAYAEPTKEQRQYTNLSYVGQSKDVFNFFIVTGNTELKVGGALAYMLALDGEFYLITGGYGADNSNSLSFDSVPAGSMDGEALGQAIDIVESIKIF